MATGLFLTIQFSAQMSSLDHTHQAITNSTISHNLTVTLVHFLNFLFFVYCILPLFVTYYILFIYLYTVCP